MDTTYTKAVSLAVPVFLGLIFLELLADWRKRTHYYRLADALNSLSCGVISTGTRVFFGFLGIYFYERAWQLSAWKLPGDHWAVWIGAFILYDLCYYWNHRLGHTMGIFWASHVVHHQSEEFNLTTALRQPGTGTLLGWIFYLPLAFAGVPLGVYLLVSVVQLFYQFWPHTQLIGRLGVLDRWVQTPSNHRVHHAQNGIYLDKNYVGVFLIWDHLFGTYQDELAEEPCIYGIRGQLKSWNPVWANLHYYWAMAQDSWRAARWSDKLRVWVAHPGWRPADVAATYPKRAYDPRVDFARFDPARGAALSWYALAQFVALIAANSHFLAVLPRQSMALNFVYFTWILAGLVAVGGVLENRRGFLRLEAVRLVALAGYALAAGSWFGFPAVAWIAGFAAASLAGLYLAARGEPGLKAA